MTQQSDQRHAHMGASELVVRWSGLLCRERRGNIGITGRVNRPVAEDGSSYRNKRIKDCAYG